MQIKYIGSSEKMTIGFPIGGSRKLWKKTITWYKGETHELEDKDGQALLAADFELVPQNELREDFQAEHISKEGPNAQGVMMYRRQKNFVNPQAVKQEYASPADEVLQKAGAHVEGLRHVPEVDHAIKEKEEKTILKKKGK